MVKCSYCGEDIDREAFCKPSHKTMFYRGLKSAPEKTLGGERIKITSPEKFEPCEHGAGKGLCKFGCK